MSETKERARTVVKEVPNAVLYSDGTILLKNVRASHPHLFEPQPNKNDKGEITGHSYSVVALMPKATHDEAKKLCVKAINDLLREHNKGEKIPANRKFVKDGDPTDDDDVGKPENEGCWIVNTREAKAPILLGKGRDPATGRRKRLAPRDKDLIYGGCYVHVLIRPWFQNNAYGKRVNAGVSAVQFLRDGEPFGTGRITDDDVDDTFEGDDEEAEEDDVDDL